MTVIFNLVLCLLLLSSYQPSLAQDLGPQEPSPKSQLAQSWEEALTYEVYGPGLGWQEVARESLLDHHPELIRISAIPSVSDDLEAYYRVAVKDVGWLGWVPLGQTTGSQDLQRPIEAYQVVEGPIESAPSTPPALLSWSDLALSSQFEQAEQEGQLVLTAIEVVQSHSLLGEVLVRTKGASALTGLQLSLTGLMAERYKLSYRIATAAGWSDWVSQGQWAEQVDGLPLLDYEINLDLKVPPSDLPELTADGQLILPQALEANTYPVGQCTWGVKEMAPWIPNWLGHAKNWYVKAQELGFETGDQPRPGAIIVWEGPEGDPYGHVALVTAVMATDWIEVLESNIGGIQEIRDFRGAFNPHQTTSARVLGYIYPPD